MPGSVSLGLPGNNVETPTANPLRGAVLPPSITEIIKESVRGYGLSSTKLDETSPVRIPMEMEANWAHTGKCVKKQRRELWNLFARYIDSVVSDADLGSGTTGFDIFAETFGCGCGTWSLNLFRVELEFGTGETGEGDDVLKADERLSVPATIRWVRIEEDGN